MKKENKQQQHKEDNGRYCFYSVLRMHTPTHAQHTRCYLHVNARYVDAIIVQLGETAAQARV